MTVQCAASAFKLKLTQFESHRKEWRQNAWNAPSLRSCKPLFASLLKEEKPSTHAYLYLYLYLHKQAPMPFVSFTPAPHNKYSKDY